MHVSKKYNRGTNKGNILKVKEFFKSSSSLGSQDSEKATTTRFRNSIKENCFFLHQQVTMVNS